MSMILFQPILVSSLDAKYTATLSIADTCPASRADNLPITLCEVFNY